MTKSTMTKRLFIAPESLSTSYGGPGTFVRNLAKILRSFDIETIWGVNSSCGAGDTILLINGTRFIVPIIRAKRRGARIIQRLGLPSEDFFVAHPHLVWSPRYRLSAFSINFARKKIASQVVYQSRYTKYRWHQQSGDSRSPESIILNGTDTDHYKPAVGSDYYDPGSPKRLVIVEGNVDAKPHGIETFVSDVLTQHNLDFQIHVYGSVEDSIVESNRGRANIIYHGRVDKDTLALELPGATAILLTDFSAACPNSLMEAMSCGVPGLAYDFGPAPEIIGKDAGVLIPPAGDPAKGDQPGNIEGLVNSLVTIDKNYQQMSTAARSRIEKNFSLNKMAEGYINLMASPIR